MAELVLGIGTSHAPQLKIPPEKWHLMQEKDQKDPRYNYQEVLRRAKPEIQKELTADVFKKKFATCHAALAKLRETLTRVAPDVVVIFGDDQHEQFWEDNMPMFSIYYGDTVERRERNRNTWWNADAAYPPDGDHVYQCDSQLARHLIKESIARGFDVASSNKLRAEIGLGHAFTFVTNDLLPKPIPIVPVMINAFFPPNQPMPGRCYALGRALCEAIKSWDSRRRVAVIASGGLSHFVIDEELDRMVLEGVLKKDKDKLFNLPLNRLWYLGNGEALNWLIVAGAVENFNPELLDYVPCHRTPAGTGCAMAFVQWN
jgi:hypothetical protein